MSSSAIINKKAVFMGGFSRSGTTLLQGLLCNSPKTMENTRECSYLRALVQAYSLASNPPYNLHAQDYFDKDEDLLFFHRKILKTYFDHLGKRFGQGIPVQKEPTLMAYFPELAELMPKSVFVATIRDPRDALASQIKRVQKSNGQMNINAWFQSQFGRVLRLNEHIDKVKGRLVFVRYESLCLEPENTMAKLDDTLSKLGYKLNLAEAPVDEWESKRDANEESASPLDGKAVQSSSIGNFKKILTNEQIQALNGQKSQFHKATAIDWFCADKIDEISLYPDVHILNS